MNGDGIEFGEIRQRPLAVVLPPCQDGHYATIAIGSPAGDDLPVYVDLDVWLELENHAHSNTRVELGGVLLGEQAVDAAGRPLVIVRDCLRARHYEATRGSFKFTHATWSELARRRERMNPQLSIVGWYHTHPGWGIFLSEMDEFICRHFFGQPLDVALVIDPCQHEQGWFQWGPDGRTRRCGGFQLFTSRLRQHELQSVLESDDEDHAMKRPLGMDESGRRPAGGWAVAGSTNPGLLAWATLLIAGLQTLVLALLVVRILVPGVPPPAGPAGGGRPTLADVASLEAENRLYRELAGTWLEARGQPADLAEEVVRLKQERDGLAEANRSHLVRIREIESSAGQAQRTAGELAQRVAALERQLAQRPDPVELRPAVDPAVDAASGLGDTVNWWLWGTVGGLGLCFAVGAVLWVLSRRPEFPPISGFDEFAGVPGRGRAGEARPGAGEEASMDSRLEQPAAMTDPADQANG